MPGENHEDFNLETAVSDIGDSLGFGGDSDADDSLDVSVDVAGSEPGQPATGELAAGAEAETGVGGAEETAPAANNVSLAPPRTWRQEAAAEWANLPPTVQAEIAKREEDIFKGIEGYKADAAFGKSVQGALAPFENVMKQYNIDPIRQVGEMMNAHYTLALGTEEQKLSLVRQIVADYGIDVTKAFGGELTAETPYVDPEVLALRKELASVKSVTSTIQQERLTQQRQSIESEVAQFAADKSNVYFNDVVKDMAQLIQTNQAASVKDAYEKAIWLNPAVRAKEIARQQAELSAKAVKEAEAKAAAAKKASSVNVRSSAKSGSAAAPLGSMDDTLAETLAAINARA